MSRTACACANCQPEPSCTVTASQAACVWARTPISGREFRIMSGRTFGALSSAAHVQGRANHRSRRPFSNSPRGWPARLVSTLGRRRCISGVGANCSPSEAHLPGGANTQRRHAVQALIQIWVEQFDGLMGPAATRRHVDEAACTARAAAQARPLPALRCCRPSDKNARASAPDPEHATANRSNTHPPSAAREDLLARVG